ncbi:hypothetical protein A3I27_04670 [Candidatus Giovannonibacteria bacterium RIFCSPLOWO2_02_FULL_43_11b]|uniref:Uncharacterized protein n=1 Tax=Candidatus Giovannonibacteria bacterium RIFCSPHIGHO2_12_FULL_43_15 TaxID=1798341 RepID=A0A1F5WRF6_9BACT|nr:MAG: hypothetical protein A2739_02410 [Candidatus Giovannonibacteria bacterium RIFCSPHIGHO2_01_FULL_43_100]OGF67259.1 MAG: hypothetical protein A3B97_00405 [Candidatus Giovannonibacteria bacterium RIFCSPHIGHO2_02_FULL_43_32]OGF78252.1 MAG: hypothetical protein A3F23_02365 [Candidatus Giovannonibacteria bacterium RIFCSPHIGHO2_12_FULL_43_15]OGF78757.1 MAG: hypothetical protein A3A15_00855 [Candidatus Giovannonibacteria bacterium RIFCSPLOWO2_01_FULL_43_60]OGF90319.1 MAG: hypothetical protein A3
MRNTKLIKADLSLVLIFVFLAVPTLAYRFGGKFLIDTFSAYKRKLFTSLTDVDKKSSEFLRAVIVNEAMADTGSSPPPSKTGCGG